MKRRACIALTVGAASAVVRQRALAQQPTGLPVIGLLGGTAPQPGVVAPFLEGLAQAGFSVGRNVAIEYRWANNQAERLPSISAALRLRSVSPR